MTRYRLIGVVLRDGKAAATAEAAGFLEDIITAIREQYPDVELIVRGDSGYGMPEMIALCRRLDVRFCFGKAKNAVLLRLAAPVAARLEAAEAQRAERARRRRGCRAFGDLEYQAGGWPQSERVVVKWEETFGSPNPRFVVADLTVAAGWSAHAVYRFYCARGDRENRIKEFKLDMAGDRLSCQTFLANQCRLLLHGAAYVLYQAVQETVRAVAPAHELARAQVGTLRSRLMKVAAQIKERCRVVRIQLCSSFPEQALWQRVAVRLMRAVT